MTIMSEGDRSALGALLKRGVCTHYWVTRNYTMRLWDGTEDHVRLMYPPKAGVAMVELPGFVRDAFGDERRMYQTMSAEHFVESVMSYC